MEEINSSTRPNLDLMALIKQNVQLERLENLRTIQNNRKLGILDLIHAEQCGQ